MERMLEGRYGRNEETMIRIHRKKRQVRIGRKTVPLTPIEHRLVTVLGMLDNRVAPRDLLLEELCEDRVQIPADQEALSMHLCRPRKKLGPDCLQVRR